MVRCGGVVPLLGVGEGVSLLGGGPLLRPLGTPMGVSMWGGGLLYPAGNHRRCSISLPHCITVHAAPAVGGTVPVVFTARDFTIAVQRWENVVDQLLL